MDWSTFTLSNAAGFIKGPGLEFDDMLASAASQITIGSITLDPRPGNPGATYHVTEDGTSINALGLPNPGAVEARRFGSTLRNRAVDANKQLRWSIAEFSPTTYAQVAGLLQAYGVIEINLGCPNVWSGTTQKTIAAFNLDLMEEIVEEVSKEVDGPFDIKVSPYSDPGFIPEVVNMALRYPIGSVITSNTFPNGIAFREGRFKTLDVPNGYGGVGGSAMRHIALGQVMQFANACKSTGLKIIGVGGISTGEHLVAMRSAGASGVQIGTAFAGPRRAGIFSDMLQEAISFVE